MSMSNRTRTETESSEMESDFSPLVDVLDEAAVGEGVSEGVSGLGKNGENNGEGSDDAFQEDVENRRNKESEVVKCIVGKRKRGRPSEKDKEGLSVSKKVKNSPRKRKTLKTKTYSNNNGKSNGFTKFYIKSITEKCIFCHDEHLRDFLGGNGSG